MHYLFKHVLMRDDDAYATRRSFLENVAAHRTIVVEWQRAEAGASQRGV